MIRVALIAIFLAFTSSLFAQSKTELKVNKHLVAGDTAKALKKLNKGIDKFPNQSDLYLMRAKLKMQRNDLDPAMVDLNSYCSLNETCEEANFLKGKIRYQQGDYKGCITHFDGTKNTVFEEQSLVYKGLAYMWQYQQVYAENVFKEALQKFPNSTSALYNACLLAYRMEKYDYANELATKLLQLSPNDKDAQLSQALIFTKLKKYLESNLLLREMQKTDEKNPTINYSIGVNYYHLEERDLACDYFRRARDQGHDQAQMALRNYCKGR